MDYGNKDRRSWSELLSRQTVAMIESAPAEEQAKITKALAEITKEPVAMLTCSRCGWATIIRSFDNLERAQEWLKLHREKYHVAKK